MHSSKVISIGEALIDRLGSPGENSFSSEFVKDCFGGAPANVACALSRLGVNVSFIGSLGNDSFGKRFQNLMDQRGINTLGLQSDDLRPTRIVLVRRDNDGERFFEGFQGDRGYGFADQAIFSSKIKEKWDLISKNAKWLIAGSIPLASEISGEALLWTLERAFDLRIQIAMDLNWRPTFWTHQVSQDMTPSAKDRKKIRSIMKYVSLLKLAKEEAIWFFGSSNPREISSIFQQQPAVIVTDGPNPISWYLNKHQGITKAILPTSVIDTTGAGDAFTAGVIYKLLSFNLNQINFQMAKDIIGFATACGAYVCQGVGAIDSQPLKEDVEQLLSSYEGGIS